MKTHIPSQTEVFKFLEDLRISGVTNMFGASPYIQKKFAVDKETALKFLSDWMQSYSK